MECFTVTAEMRSPLIMNGGYFTLDALLAALLFERLSNVENAHSAVPLTSTSGLFHASAAIFEPYSKEKISFVANLQAQHTLEADHLKKNKKGQVHTKIGLTRRREFGAVMNTYRSFSASEVHWYAEGDPAEVEKLIENVTFIGKRRGSGFGEVSRWRIEPGELNGVVGHFGEPMRPVPLDLFTGDKDELKVDAAWKPAYWHPKNRGLCYAPRLIQ